jgi:hypothetical protein
MRTRYNVDPLIDFLAKLAGKPLAIPQERRDLWANKAWSPDKSNPAKLCSDIASMFVCSDKARSAIEALLMNRDIEHVPVDSRDAAEEEFRSWADDTEHLYFKNSAESDKDDDKDFKPLSYRRPLLTTCGARGAGKSVLQAFHMAWYKMEYGGVPIEVNFSGDQASITRDQLKYSRKGELELDHNFPSDFEHAVALRVLHRVLLGHGVGEEFFKAHRKVIIEALMETESTATTLGHSSWGPLSVAQAVARRLLGAPENSNVLLVVDDIGCFGATGQEVEDELDDGSVRRLLDFLLDAQNVELRLFLSVSCKSATAVSRFASNYSGHTPWPQELPPITPVAASLLPHAHCGTPRLGHLPPILRVFADESRRPALPIEGQPLYTRLLQILSEAEMSGHPRSVSAVFRILKDPSFFPADVDKLMAGGQLCEALQMAMDKGLEKSCQEALEQAKFFQSKVPQGPDLEQVARYTARPFRFPASRCAYGTPSQQLTIKNVREGFCQLLHFAPDSSPSSESSSLQSTWCWDRDELPYHCVTFVPWAVLQCSYAAADRIETPCAQALSLVTQALGDYSKPGPGETPEKRGKSFAKLALGSLLLSLRAHSDAHNHDTKGLLLNRTIPATSQARKTNWPLAGGEKDMDIMLWENATHFPLPGSLQHLLARVDQLPSNAAGAMFMSPQSTAASQVFGLFRSAEVAAKKDDDDKDHYMLLVVMCKDWFRPPANATDVLKEWRESQKLVRLAAPTFSVPAPGNSLEAANAYAAPSGTDSLKSITDAASVRFEFPNARAVVDVQFCSHRARCPVRGQRLARTRAC